MMVSLSFYILSTLGLLLDKAIEEELLIRHLNVCTVECALIRVVVDDMNVITTPLIMMML